MHIALHAPATVDAASPSNLLFYMHVFLVYSSFRSKQTIMQIPLKSSLFSRFQNGLSPSPFQCLLGSLCIFDKSSKATGYASLSVICHQEMNGYFGALLRAFVSCSFWGQTAQKKQASRGEQQRKIWFRDSPEKFICDINIWYLKHGCVCVHQDKVPFKFSRTCHWVWISK